jgi:hypothetical protein
MSEDTPRGEERPGAPEPHAAEPEAAAEVRSDPTAPEWTSPSGGGATASDTTVIGQPPTSALPEQPDPYAGAPAYGQPPAPAYGQGPPPGYGQTAPPAYGETPPQAPAYGQAPPPAYGPGAPDPYGAPPAYGAVQPYGGQPYAGQPYAADPYGGQPYGGAPAYPPPTAASPYGARGGTNGSALTLVILSGVLILFCGGLLLIPAAVFGAIGLAKHAGDPVGASRMTRYGWIAFAVGIVATVVVAAILLAVVIGAGGAFDPTGTY